MNDTQLFAFENDFVVSLRCVPMAVRLKLDRCGVKLTLRQWSRFTRQDRQALLEAPCHSDDEAADYRSRLVELVALRAREVATPMPDPPAPLWTLAGETPPGIAEYAVAQGVAPPNANAWRRLTELQRFALIKLSRDNHDNVNFLPAMREFGLVS